MSTATETRLHFLSRVAAPLNDALIQMRAQSLKSYDLVRFPDGDVYGYADGKQASVGAIFWTIGNEQRTHSAQSYLEAYGDEMEHDYVLALMDI